MLLSFGFFYFVGGCNYVSVKAGVLQHSGDYHDDDDDDSGIACVVIRGLHNENAD